MKIIRMRKIAAGCLLAIIFLSIIRCGTVASVQPIGKGERPTRSEITRKTEVREATKPAVTTGVDTDEASGGSSAGDRADPGCVRVNCVRRQVSQVWR